MTERRLGARIRRAVPGAYQGRLRRPVKYARIVSARALNQLERDSYELVSYEVA